MNKLTGQAKMAAFIPDDTVRSAWSRREEKAVAPFPSKRQLLRQASPSPAAENDFFHYPCSTQEIIDQKKKFLVFLRILLKYLQRRDPGRHAEVKAVLREFATSCGGPTVGLSRKHDKYDLLQIHSLVKKMVTETQWNDTLYVLRMYMMQRQDKAKNVVRSRKEARTVISLDGS